MPHEVAVPIPSHNYCCLKRTPHQGRSQPHSNFQSHCCSKSSSGCSSPILIGSSGFIINLDCIHSFYCLEASRSSVNTHLALSELPKDILPVAIPKSRYKEDLEIASSSLDNICISNITNIYWELKTGGSLSLADTFSCILYNNSGRKIQLLHPFSRWVNKAEKLSSLTITLLSSYHQKGDTCKMSPIWSSGSPISFLWLAESSDDWSCGDEYW